MSMWRYPESECGADGIPGLVRGRLEDAETERGHLDAVVEGDGFHPVHPGFNTLLPLFCRPSTTLRQLEADVIACRTASSVRCRSSSRERRSVAVLVALVAVGALPSLTIPLRLWGALREITDLRHAANFRA